MASRKKARRKPGKADSADELNPAEAQEVADLVSAMRALAEDYEQSLAVLSEDAPPLANYHRPDSIRLQRKLLEIARGRGGQSMASLARALAPQDSHKPLPPRYATQHRDDVILFACHHVTRWLAGRDESGNPVFDQDDELLMHAQHAVLAVRRLVDPGDGELSQEAWADLFQRAFASRHVQDARHGRDGRRGGNHNTAVALIAELSSKTGKPLEAETIRKAVQSSKAARKRVASKRAKLFR